MTSPRSPSRENGVASVTGTELGFADGPQQHLNHVQSDYFTARAMEENRTLVMRQEIAGEQRRKEAPKLQVPFGKDGFLGRVSVQLVWQGR